jgi:hypothetical protein
MEKENFMKKSLFFLIICFGLSSQNIKAQNNDLLGMDLGLQISTLGEIGFFMAYKPIYFGIGMHLWNDIESEPYWNDITYRLGYSHKFKIGIGLLGGLQIRMVSASLKNTMDTKLNFVFLPEIGISYTWKRLYGNVTYQFDTNNIKNSTLCFVIGGSL